MLNLQQGDPGSKSGRWEFVSVLRIFGYGAVYYTIARNTPTEIMEGWRLRGRPRLRWLYSNNSDKEVLGCSDNERADLQ